jgi:glycosyltransferase involved in cell wall biosynthesis
VRIVQASYFRDPRGRPPEDLLRDWPALADVACAVAGAGLEVHVVQAAAESAEIVRDGVTFHFVGERSTRWSTRRPWLTVPSGHLRRQIRALAPDVLHVHSLGFPIALRLTVMDVPSPVLVQDHADAVPGNPVRWLTAAALRRCAAVAFTAREQAGPWREAGCLPSHLPVFEVPESSSRFTPGDRTAARSAAAIFGEPAVAWVGRLASVKDPLTALRAFAEAAPRLPDPQLWCCYTEAPLLDRVVELARGDERLRGRVHLLERLPHERVETLLRACDVYLAASRREGSGFALLEALACGLPAVVTDIPSFRRLTGDGAVAALVPPGDADAMGRALRQWYEQPRQREREAVRAHFERHLSFAAVGTGLRNAYEQISGARCA